MNQLPLVLQLLVLLLGGGAVQLVVFLFSRRAQLRGMDTTSDATIVNSATTLIDRLQKDGETLRALALSLNTQIEGLKNEQRIDRAEFVAQLTRSHDETARVSTQVAQLKTDLGITHRQIAELEEGHLRMRMDISKEA